MTFNKCRVHFMNHYIRSVRNHLNKSENNTEIRYNLNEISSYILYLFQKAVIFTV